MSQNSLFTTTTCCFFFGRRWCFEYRIEVDATLSVWSRPSASFAFALAFRTSTDITDKRLERRIVKWVKATGARLTFEGSHHVRLAQLVTGWNEYKKPQVYKIELISSTFHNHSLSHALYTSLLRVHVLPIVYIRATTDCCCCSTVAIAAVCL